MRSAPVRRLQRAVKWTALGLAGIAVACLVPVAAVEGACTVGVDPAWQGGSRYGIPDAGYRLPGGDSYLGYPGADVAYAYDDLAAVAGASSKSSFDYLGATAGFWRGMCGASVAASRTGETSPGLRAADYLDGIGLTVGMVGQGAWERTVGALTAWWRGPDPTAEDRFEARLLADYAASLRRGPWHDYPFGSALGRLWGEVPFEPSVRSVERRAWLTVLYSVKLVAAQVAGLASAPAAPRAPVRSVVAGLDANDAKADPRLAVLASVPTGDGTLAYLVESPGDGAFTEVLRGLVARNRILLEIAGNRRVLTTVLLPEGVDPLLDGAFKLFVVPVQSRPGWRRVGYDTEVTSLAAQLRSVEARGGRFERAYAP